MSTQTIKIKLLREGAELPAYQTDGSSGLDLKACFKDYGDIKKPDFEEAVINLSQSGTPSCALILSPGQRVIIPTGIAMAIPAGYEGQVRPRSGVTFKQGLCVANSPGTIDSDYRGEIGVIVINHSQKAQIIRNGDRIAQFVLVKVDKIAAWEVTDTLNDTDRGAGGYGSTGL